jgi:hypothetical protein
VRRLWDNCSSLALRVSIQSGFPVHREIFVGGTIGIFLVKFPFILVSPCMGRKVIADIIPNHLGYKFPFSLISPLMGRVRSESRAQRGFQAQIDTPIFYSQ